MLVLLALVAIAAVTLSVLRFIANEIGGSIREWQSGQVLEIAQAGVHFAIGKLQVAGARVYAGEPLAVKDGDTTLGTAVVVVNCPDTGTPPPCAGQYAAYRRIISTGRLPWSGPSRTIVAVVQATIGAPDGICAYNGGVEIGGPAKVYSDVGSDGGIVLSGGPARAQIAADPHTPQQFKGTMAAMGRIDCGTSCTGQAQGGVLAGQTATICPGLASPRYSPGGSNLYVGGGGFTINAATGYSWRDVRVAPGSCAGPAPFTDLSLQADPSNPYATTVIQFNSLIMGNCSRLVIFGAGRIELRIAEPSRSGLIAFVNARFAVLPGDTFDRPAPVPAARFVTWVNSYGPGGAVPAVQLNGARIVAGTILAPHGKIQSSDVPTTAGALWGYTVSLTTSGSFVSDVSGLPPEATAYASFKRLRSWKDQ